MSSRIGTRRGRWGGEDGQRNNQAAVGNDVAGSADDVGEMGNATGGRFADLKRNPESEVANSSSGIYRRPGRGQVKGERTEDKSVLTRRSHGRGPAMVRTDVADPGTRGRACRIASCRLDGPLCPPGCSPVSTGDGGASFAWSLRPDF